MINLKFKNQCPLCNSYSISKYSNDCMNCYASFCVRNSHIYFFKVYINDMRVKLDFENNLLIIYIAQRNMISSTIPDFSNLQELTDIINTMILFN
jgi:hypothetical protein